MSQRRNRRLTVDTPVRLLVGLIILVVLAYNFSPPARAAMQAAGQMLMLALAVGAGAFIVWRLFAFKKARVSAPLDSLPRARVVHFPPQAHEEAGVRRVPLQPVVTASRPAPAPARTTIPTTPELVAQLRQLDWYQFEKVAHVIYEGLGYEVFRRGGANPDGGIDLVIEKFGERTAIQCKHWKTQKVKVSDIREFLGALLHAEIDAGIFLTLEGYTEEARELALAHHIEILDEAGLGQLLDRAGARFNPVIIAALNDRRKFCPKCGVEMVLRTAAKGENAGGQFWGCPNYPRCRQILSLAE